MDHTANTLDTFDRCASEYAQKFMDVSSYAEPLLSFCNKLVEGSCILDVGCGPGNISRFLLQYRPDLNIRGIDFSPKMVEIASFTNPGARYTVMDCRKIRSLEGKFDGILCSFCTPYLSRDETITLISDAAEMLRHQGVLYLSTMEGDYSSSRLQKSSSGEFETYIHYHEHGYLTAAFQSSGLEVLMTARQPYPSAGQATATDLFLLGVKR